MTKKDPKENLKPFLPGQSGNPNGRPKIPEDIKKALKLNAFELTRVLNRYLYMNLSELQTDLRRPEATMLELMGGRMVAKAAKDSDTIRATFILDRTIGKVVNHIEIAIPKPTILTKLDGTQLVLGHEEQAVIEAEVSDE